MSKQPVEAKVTAGTVGAGIAGAVVVLVMNLIQRQPLDETALQLVIAAVVTSLVTFIAGWSARHTRRPDLEPPPPPPTAPTA